MCKDDSCKGLGACLGATIDYVVGPSCTSDTGGACKDAQIGSVDSSCRASGSCGSAQLSGVNLINSCNRGFACKDTNGNDEDFELSNCCNDKDYQCDGKTGKDAIFTACVSY